MTNPQKSSVIEQPTLPESAVELALNAALGLNTTVSDMLRHPDQHDREWKRHIIRAAVQAALATPAQPKASETEKDSECKEADGCPTEKAVLQRFWRSHHPKASEGKALDREWLGRMVRDERIAWAQQQPNPEPSWLVPWDGLSEPDREVDRRIGYRLASYGLHLASDVR